MKPEPVQPDPIGEADLQLYLDEVSDDFTFELAARRVVRASTKNVRHGELYVDPKTHKSRQFDLRVIYAGPRDVVYYLAIECKNIHAHAPLLISCVLRPWHESWHNVIDIEPASTTRTVAARCIRCSDGRYQPGRPVGKCCAQVSRARAVGPRQMMGSDSDLFDKWTQALASARGLVEDAAAYEGGAPPHSACVLPVVVVPDERLWVVEYNEDGTRGKPERANSAAMYLRDEFRVDFRPKKFAFSHLEFVTLTGLRDLMQYLKTENASEMFFSD